MICVRATTGNRDHGLSGVLRKHMHSAMRTASGNRQISFAETCSCREVVEVLVTTPAELDGGAVAAE